MSSIRWLRAARRHAAVGLGALLALVAQAQTVAPAPPAEAPPPPAPLLHPWQVPPPRLATEAYFTNLDSGSKIETPFLLKFGLSGGWGIAPINPPVGGRTGHHHLLVNRDLPLDFKKALPFNDQYIHFGKGQMETVLTLAPGTYSLRLLLADAQHLPHFIYSKPLSVTVTKRNDKVAPQSLVKPGIALLNLPADAHYKPPFRLQFHASGLNVAPADPKEKDTGHFRLIMTPKTGAPAEMNFTLGQTEVWLSPPPGNYALKLDFVDNANPGRTLAETATGTVRIE